jgi:hypothetical protein
MRVGLLSSLHLSNIGLGACPNALGRVTKDVDVERTLIARRTLCGLRIGSLDLA